MDATDSDPLYFSKEFLETLDPIQKKLMQESKAWLIPRDTFLKKSITENS